MTDQVVSKNIGALITVRDASTSNAITAGGTGDATTKTGISIDREGLVGDSGSLPLSMVAGVLFDATLASGSTLSIQINVMDSADNSNFSTYASQANTVAATGPSGGGVVSGQQNFNVNLSTARRFIRVDYVPDLSRAGTDTAILRAVAVLAGFDRLAAAP